MNQTSIWQNDMNFKAFQSLNKDIKTNVLIIGGGIAGILTAYELESRGIEYVLVEKSKICSGVTKNTTAKITSQHGLIYQKLFKNNDATMARLYYEFNNNAISKYEKLSRQYDIDFEYKDNYVYSTNSNDKLYKEAKALSCANIPYDFCENIELPILTYGAIKFPNQAQFNPAKLLSRLSKNLNIYENTFVQRIEDNTAITENARIKADKIVIATHFPFINKHGLYPLKMYQDRSYVIACKDAQKLNGMYIDESGKGLSFRSYNDNLLIGGGSHRTGCEGSCWSKIEDFKDKHYPDAKVIYRWAAQDCMTLDNFAYIGKYSKSTPNLFVVTGFNKWGMTTAMSGAELIADLIEGKTNDYADLFSPSRSMLKPQLFINSGYAVSNLLSFSPKRCTHLGCSLKWNKAEHSWDCACHGSRYNEAGRVINNPAQNDLNI